MRKDKALADDVEEMPSNSSGTRNRRISLEKKILGLLRRYRAAEKRRRRRQEALGEQSPGIPHSPGGARGAWSWQETRKRI